MLSDGERLRFEGVETSLQSTKLLQSNPSIMAETPKTEQTETQLKLLKKLMEMADGDNVQRNQASCITSILEACETPEQYNDAVEKSLDFVKKNGRPTRK